MIKMIDVVKSLVEYLKEHDISNAESPLREIKNNTSIDSSVLLQYSDNDILESIKQLAPGSDVIKNIINKIKMEHSIEKYEAEKKVDYEEMEKKYLMELFSEVAVPERIIIEQNRVKVEYSYETEDELRMKVNDISRWKIDNARESISEEVGIPIDDVQVIKSVNEYVDFISKLEDESFYVSRGQKDCTFKLLPSLHRIYSGEYASHSTALETEFKQKVSFYDRTLNMKSDEEIRAYAQHFGLPTNYLDFTEAHLISLLFAVEEYSYNLQHSVVYFVDALSYNREVIKEDVKLVDFSNSNDKEVKERRYGDKSYFIRVGNSNERIHFQKGCFLKVANDGDLSLLLKKYTKIVLIDKECKEQILKDLFRLGITFENIYPDKDNVVKTIIFRKDNM